MKNFTLGFIVGFITAPFAYAAVKFYQSKCEDLKDKNMEVHRCNCDDKCDTSYQVDDDAGEEMTPCE